MYDVELNQVVKEFPARRGAEPVRAVDNISLKIKDGEFFALLGPSGCGKTTTLRMIAGFEDVTSGEILIKGQSVQHVPPFHRPVNTVFQDYALFPHMTGLQNVMFGLEMSGLRRSEARERARQALEMVQLPQAANRKPRELSGGQQQRVALARALVNNPTVLLLDEPLGALDLKLRKDMQFELKAMQRDLGITFIYVTHDQEEALTMADRIAVMNAGQVLQIGEPQEIYEQPHTRFVADFIGETNFIVGRLTEKSGQEACVALSENSSVGAVLDDLEMTIGSDVTIAIRPEKIAIFPQEGAAKRADNFEMDAAEMLRYLQAESNSAVIPATILQSIYIGTDMRHVVRLDASGHEMVVRVQNFGRRYDQTFETGQSVYVHWVEENARILRD